MADDNIPTSTAKVATTLITSLPPAFVMLLIIVAVFVGGLIWYAMNQAEKRVELLRIMMEACPALKVAPPTR